jgi:hypothetical protein
MLGNASKNPIGHYLRQRGGNRAKAGRKGERTRAMVGVKWCEREAQQHSPRGRDRANRAELRRK